ncbi:hypothetical protein SCUCBS95973_001738 [Sporothrix curviconia]|uniref:Subtelomeric hrmA-associated cluster protein AFUB-079030/YDR124W-like helical bundle domain-containing protein n=1 Tax=Sporothrix curviconia TaxID=1260050 RepID=A0ABP0B114_9PEZI
MSRPLNLERALRVYCRIPAQCYFVSAILDTGETVTFSGPTEYKDKIPTFFDMNRWMRCATGQSPSVADPLAAPDSVYEDHGHPRSRSRNPHVQASSQLSPTQAGFGPHASDYEGRRGGYDRRRMQDIDEFDEDFHRNRKRARGTTARRVVEMAEERPVRVTRPTKIPIQISEEQAIWKIYDQRFRGLQQTACKLIAKAWVKLVEPKKQSTHPYTGSDEKAPDWWPKPWGNTRDEKVRHKEPDHLYKKERVHLLKHILRMIVVPNSEQHPDIQKLHLNVAKLEEATTEVLSSFFADKDSPNNMKKRPYLKEIFLLAKYEERFRNGEIDGTTNVYIMSEEKLPDNYQSDDDSSVIKADEEEVMRGPVTLSPNRTMPQALHGPTRTATSTGVAPSAHSSTPSHSGDRSPGTGGLSAGPGSASHAFMGEIPHRGHSTYPPPQMMHHPDMGASDHHTGYVDSGNGMGVGNSPSQQQHHHQQPQHQHQQHQHHPAHQNLPHPHQQPLTESHSSVSLQQIVPNPHETSRRSSIFSPTSEYSGTPTSANVYQTWQPQPQQSSNPPSASSMYTFPPHQVQATQHTSFVPQAPVAPVGGVGSVGLAPPSHGYMGHGFDSMPRTSYDTAPHDTMFRQSGVAHSGGVNPPGTYSIPLPQDTRALPNHGLKTEPPNRHLH